MQRDMKKTNFATTVLVAAGVSLRTHIISPITSKEMYNQEKIVVADYTETTNG